ncbi:MAG TPA: hypothetical protein VGB55_00480, partial [Tepidisphaeraceae bacterium]
TWRGRLAREACTHAGWPYPAEKAKDVLPSSQAPASLRDGFFRCAKCLRTDTSGGTPKPRLIFGSGQSLSLA